MNSLLALGIGGPEILVLGGMLFLGLPLLALWIWMLIDCLTKEADQSQKLVWLLVIIFVGFVGAPLYLFIRKLPRDRQTP